MDKGIEVKKVKLDPAKVIYDGNSFTVVYTEDELSKAFKTLKQSIKEMLSKQIQTKNKVKMTQLTSKTKPGIL